MKNFSVALFYAILVIVGIFMFLSIRWFVLNGNPVFYESTHKTIMSPEEVKSEGLYFDANKQYYQVEKKKTYLRSGKFPLIEKEVVLTTELEVLPEDKE